MRLTIRKMIPLKKLHIFSILLLLICFQITKGDCARALDYDVRIIHDLSTIYMSPAFQEKGRNWLLLQITPNESTDSRFEGISEDVDTGEISALGPVSFVYTGVAKAIYSFDQSKSIEQEFPYKRKQPGILFGQSVITRAGSQSKYLLYEYSGLAVAQLNAEKDDLSHFEPLYLLPAEWANFVPQAFVIQQVHLEAFKFNGKKATEDNIRKLRSFARDQNPLISIAAVHRILQQRRFDPSLSSEIEFIQELMLKSSGFKQAVLLSLIIQWSTETEKENLLRLLQNAVEKTDNSAALLWLTFGAFATRELRNSGHRRFSQETIVAAEEILTLIASKRIVMDMQTDEDKYVDVILRASGFR